MRKAYVWERVYPHVISFVLIMLLFKLSFNPLESTGLDSLVEGIVTLDSIIIGFMGAIISVILSMKNDSKLVKYVFEKDTDGLFKRYLLETIAYGLIDVCISLLCYIRDIITNKYIIKIFPYILIYAFFLFVFSTYRSMSCMLKLIFSDDTKIDEEISNKLDKNESDRLWNEKGK